MRQIKETCSPVLEPVRSDASYRESRSSSPEFRVAQNDHLHKQCPSQLDEAIPRLLSCIFGLGDIPFVGKLSALGNFHVKTIFWRDRHIVLVDFGAGKLDLSLVRPFSGRAKSAATASLCNRRTLNPAIDAASMVAWRWLFEKNAGTVITASTTSS
jgi:hypothetical protein